MESTQNEVKDSMLPPVLKEYDSFTSSLKNQIEFYKQEHTALRADVAALLEENQQLSGQLKAALSSNLSKEPAGEYRHRTADMVANLQRQLLLTSQEKAAAMELYQTTVRELETLEVELEAYRDNRHLDAASRNLEEVKGEYSTAIALLEEKVESLQAELSRERSNRERTEDDVRHACAERDRLASSLKECENQLEGMLQGQTGTLSRLEAATSQTKQLSDELEAMKQQRDEMEAALTESMQRTEELRRREWAALARVEEALTLVDAAVLEKNAALVAEAQAKEEVAKLQKSVEQLLEEAGKRVAEEGGRLKKQYNDQMEMVLRDMRGLQEEVARKSAQLEKTGLDLQRLEDELEKERKERSSLPDPLQLQRNVDNTYRELRRVEQEVIEVSRDRDRLLMRLQQAEDSHRSEMAASVDEVRRLRQDLHVAHTQAQQAEAAAQARALVMEEQLVKLEQQLSALQGASFVALPSDQIHVQCEAQIEKYKKMNAQLSAMQKQGIRVAQELQVHLDAQVDAKKKWQREVKRLNNKFEQRLDALREQLSGLRKANRNLERELAESRLSQQGRDILYTCPAPVPGPGPP